MSRLKLYWVRETEDERAPRLSDDPHGVYVECRPVGADEVLDSHDIGEFLDGKAEGENRHDLAGAHVALAKMVRDEIGDDAADALMLAILKRGGLWNLKK